MVFRRFAKIIILLAIILFFTPFVMVSCSEASASEKYSGVELMLCSVEDDSLIGLGEIDADEFSPNIWLIGACICGIAALAVLLIKKSDIIAAVLSALSAVLLIVFRASFASYYNLGEYEQYLEIKTQWGYVLCLILMIAAAICCCISQRKNE